MSVIVPAYNEALTILALLSRVEAVEPVGEIIVVDDGSTDGTRELLKEAQASGRFRLLLHPRNRGKGASIRTGLAHVTRDVVIVQDADLEYQPEEYTVLLAALHDGGDVVYGSRYLRRFAGPAWHRLGNKILTLFSNLMCGQHLTDMETCYKMIRMRLIRRLSLRCNRFGFEPEITCQLGRLGVRIQEVPIQYRHRSFREGKKIGVWDALKTVMIILYYSLSR